MVNLSASLTQWAKRWLVLPLLVLNGWVLLQAFQYLEPLVTVVVLASTLAFILNAPVQQLQQRGMSRNCAIFMILVLSAMVIGSIGLILLPTLFKQLDDIVQQLPNWIETTRHNLHVLEGWVISHRLPINLGHWLARIPDRLPEQMDTIANEAVNLVFEAVGGLSAILLTFVLAFYLLLDGERIWASILHRFPVHQRSQIQQSLQSNFRGYLIGQVTIGLLIGSLLSLSLAIMQVPYSLLLGFLIGLLSLVPFGDLVGYLIIGAFLAVQDLGLAMRVLAVCLVVDQLIDQFIAPRILGGFTGLRPVWVLVALIVGTKVAGLPGLLVAIPVAGCMNDLLFEGDLFSVQETAIAASTTEPHNGSQPAAQIELEPEHVSR